jgi:hypothetical protein
MHAIYEQIVIKKMKTPLITHDPRSHKLINVGG